MFQPCYLASCIHRKHNHIKGFNKLHRTHTNEIKDQNNLIKHPHKAMFGFLKSKLPHLNQLILKGWDNSVLPCLEESHSRAERDNMLSNF